MLLDNSALVRQFVPETMDGDTFIYTEMLDRSKKKGNNGQRLVKTFYHRSRAEFDVQMPTIRHMCDLSQVRACTRLAPRSFAKVGRYFTRLVVDTAMSENWAGMKTLYNRALGCVTPNTKLWLFDVDRITPATDRLGLLLEERGLLVATLPSKKGLHYITKPFDVRSLNMSGGGRLDDADSWTRDWGEVQLHKDNPTNLYIPDGAD